MAVALATGSTRSEAEAEAGSAIRADVLVSGAPRETLPRPEAPSSTSRTGVQRFGYGATGRCGSDEDAERTGQGAGRRAGSDASRAIPARCEITSARFDPEDPFRRLGIGGAMPGTALAAGPHFVTVLNDELCAFEDRLSDEIDDLSDVGTNKFHRPVPGVVVVVHRTRPSGANPRAGTARGPPVRTERLFPAFLVRTASDRIRPERTAHAPVRIMPMLERDDLKIHDDLSTLHHSACPAADLKSGCVWESPWRAGSHRSPVF